MRGWWEEDTKRRRMMRGRRTWRKRRRRMRGEKLVKNEVEKEVTIEALDVLQKEMMLTWMISPVVLRGSKMIRRRRCAAIIPQWRLWVCIWWGYCEAKALDYLDQMIACTSDSIWEVENVWILHCIPVRPYKVHLWSEADGWQLPHPKWAWPACQFCELPYSIKWCLVY